MRKTKIVCDLDGTLCDVRYRRHFVSGKKKDFESFHRLLVLDEPVQSVKATLNALALQDFEILLVSARPNSYRTQTEEWLNKNLIIWDELYLLRPDNDSTPDVVLKREWLKTQNKESILFCLDDRQRIVDMWREEGLTCFQVDSWEKSAVK